MRVTCPHCHGPATIGTRKTHTSTVSDLYCSCKDIEHCGATFVMTLSLSRTLNHPRASLKERVINLMRSLPASEIAALQSMTDLFSNH